MTILQSLNVNETILNLLSGQNVMKIMPNKMYEQKISLEYATALNNKYRYDRQRDINNNHVRSIYSAIIDSSKVFLPFQTPLVIVKNLTTGEKRVVDGQHRLETQIMFNVAMETYYVHEYEVTSDEETSAIACALDNNKNRTAKDKLGFQGLDKELSRLDINKGAKSTISKGVGVVMRGMDVRGKPASVSSAFSEQLAEFSKDYLYEAKEILTIMNAPACNDNTVIKKAMKTAGIFGSLLFILKNHDNRKEALAFIKLIAWGNGNRAWSLGLKNRATYLSRSTQAVHKFIKNGGTHPGALIPTYIRLIATAWENFINKTSMEKDYFPSGNEKSATAPPVIFHNLSMHQSAHQCFAEDESLTDDFKIAIKAKKVAAKAARDAEKATIREAKAIERTAVRDARDAERAAEKAARAAERAAEKAAKAAKATKQAVTPGINVPGLHEKVAATAIGDAMKKAFFN